MSPFYRVVGLALKQAPLACAHFRPAGVLGGFNEPPKAAGSEFRRIIPNARHSARQAPNQAHIKKSSLVLGLAVLLFSGCDETSAHLIFHSKLKIPDQLDSICLQIAAGGNIDFSRRYPLTEAEAGALTMSVLPGSLHSQSFDVLLRGERRGWQVSWLRETVEFETHHVLERELDIARCSGKSGQGRFIWGGRLSDKPDSAVATTPLAYPDQLIMAAWNGDTRGFVFIPNKGLMQLQTTFPSLPEGKVRRLISLDIDGDCDLDLLVLHEKGPLLWKHDGKGNFVAHPRGILVTGDFTNAAAADLNLDGYVDLVLTSQKGPRLLLNDGQRTGTFRDATNLLPTDLGEVTAVAIGFINKDFFSNKGFYPDIVFGRGSTQEMTDVVLVNQYQGAGGNLSFDKVEFGEKKRTQSLIVSDFNNDGLADVVASYSSGAPQVFLNHSTDEQNTKLDPHVTLFQPSAQDVAKDLLAVDLDDDCYIDIVVSYAQGIEIFFNDRLAQFNRVGATEPFPGAKQVVATDINGDGALDLILGGNSTGASWLIQER